MTFAVNGDGIAVNSDDEPPDVRRPEARRIDDMLTRVAGLPLPATGLDTRWSAAGSEVVPG